MEKIQFIVERLNSPPFNMGITTMSEIDSKPSIELLEILSDIVIAIDPDQEFIRKESTEGKVSQILGFLFYQAYLFFVVDI
jgi:hypothetical protein